MAWYTENPYCKIQIDSGDILANIASAAWKSGYSGSRAACRSLLIAGHDFYPIIFQGMIHRGIIHHIAAVMVGVCIAQNAHNDFIAALLCGCKQAEIISINFLSQHRLVKIHATDIKMYWLSDEGILLILVRIYADSILMTVPFGAALEVAFVCVRLRF